MSAITERPFSNGTSEMLFLEHYCYRGCKHYVVDIATEHDCPVMERAWMEKPTPELVGSDWPHCTCYERDPAWKPFRLTFRRALCRWWRKWLSAQVTPWKARIGKRLEEHRNYCFVGITLWEQDTDTWAQMKENWPAYPDCNRDCFECDRLFLDRLGDARERESCMECTERFVCERMEHTNGNGCEQKSVLLSVFLKALEVLK